MTRYYFLLFSLILFACGNDNAERNDLKTDNPDTEQTFIPIDQLAKRHVEANLKIPATEDYSLEIFEAELNGDDSMDYIVTVNRYQKAIDDAIASGKIEKYVDIGYTGKHNFFYFVNGKDKKFSPVIDVPSSPHATLDISFENITSESHKDFMVDYHIMDGYFRNYYTIKNNTPLEILRSELILHLGDKDEQAYYVEFGPGSYTLAKDVFVYEANLGDYKLDHQDDIYKVEPERIKTDKLVYHWKFHPTAGKYFMEQDK